MTPQFSNTAVPSPAGPTTTIQRIHVICAQHLDVAWLWRRVPEGEDLMRQCFKRAVEMIETYPNEPFVFSRSTAWSFHLVEQQCPDLFERVRHYLQEGKIALCGGQWVEPDHVIPGGEALVRQAALAQWYFLDRFGKTARVCWALDNFAHAGSLPQILRKAGMDGYYLTRCLPADEEGRPRMQFRWRGLDGSEVSAFRLQNMEELTEDSVRRLVEDHETAGLPAIPVKASDAYSDRRITIGADWVPLPGRIAANPDAPSVLVPLGDFFGLGHGIVNSYQSLLFSASCAPDRANQFNQGCALNTYVRMPFRERAVVELINESDEAHGQYFTSYVHHIENPVRFQREIKVTSEHGHGNHLANEMSSVAYWYADRPTAAIAPPPVAQRLPVLRDNQGNWLYDETNQCPGTPVPVNEEMREMKARREG